MYPMDKFSALLWLDTVRQAQAGNQESMEELQAANQLRSDNNQPSIEEELMQLTKG